MSNYEVGSNAVYTEGGAILLVEIVENNCDDLRDAFRLKILKTIRPHPIFGEEKVGEEFNIMHLKNAGCGSWRLIGE
jgi:hypothetical protein